MRMRFAVALAAAMSMAGVAGPPAHADDFDFPPPGYAFEGTFYRGCETAGGLGVPQAWPAYVCISDGWPWDSSDLYVEYDG